METDKNDHFVEVFMDNTGLDIEEAAELYTVFLIELFSELNEFKQSFQSSDYLNAKKVVHNIKGISGNYLATEVFSFAQQIDSKLKTGVTEHLESQVHDLEQAADHFKEITLMFFKDKGMDLEV